MLKISSDVIQPISFPKDIGPKVNVIAWLEFELAYLEAAVQHFSHYTTGTPPELRLGKYILEIDFIVWGRKKGGC